MVRIPTDLTIHSLAISTGAHARTTFRSKVSARQSMAFRATRGAFRKTINASRADSDDADAVAIAAA